MPDVFRPLDPARFAEALRRFDLANSADPNRIPFEGAEHPRELLHAVWLTDWVLKLQPDASETLRLAARCQHLCRWEIPRHSYPMTRPGYLKWREDLKQLHASKAGEILHEIGYPEDLIRRVQHLNLKKDLATDPEVKTLEDALCLVFLQRQFAGLAAKAEPGKVVNALRKSWNKMTERGRAEALKLDYSPRERELLEEALR